MFECISPPSPPQIAEWLNLNDHDEFMNIYAKVRSQVTKKSLDQLREHQLSGMAAAGAAGASEVPADGAAGRWPGREECKK